MELDFHHRRTTCEFPVETNNSKLTLADRGCGIHLVLSSTEQR
jgi:hypothetical protein